MEPVDPSSNGLSYTNFIGPAGGMRLDYRYQFIFRFFFFFFKKILFLQ